jgi:AraC-like DNA-binding protein
MQLSQQPSGPLHPYVERIWYSQRGALPHGRERILPTGCADIVVPLLQDGILRYDEDGMHPRRFLGAVVQGPADRFAVRGTGGASTVVGVHFRPGGAAAFFDGMLPAIRNRTVLLEDLWGASACVLRDELQAAASPHEALQRMHAYLLRRLRNARPADPVAAFAVSAFCRDPAGARVEPVRHATGCTPAQFIRRFEQATGLTPKRFTRVIRLGEVLPQLVRGPRDCAEVAAGAGYFDQSHLVREFRHLTGMTPGRYVPVQPGQPAHVAVPG